MVGGIGLGLVLAIHALLFLSQEWSVLARRRLSFAVLPAAELARATHVFASPAVGRSAAPAIVPLERTGAAEPTPRVAPSSALTVGGAAGAASAALASRLTARGE
jgi:hypothetical protein